MGDNNGIVFLAIILGLVIFGAMFIYHSQINQQDETISQSNGNFLSLNLYGMNGELIEENARTLSIVGGTPGVYFIDLTVTVHNTGQEALSCQLTSLSPTAFNDATTKTVKAISVGGSAAWTSNRMATSLFESNSSTTFSASVLCTYNSGTQVITLPAKQGTILLDIKPESGSAGFDVSVNQGGTPTEYCGDKVCQSSEGELSCPADCAVINHALFRTSDISYVAGSAIARTDMCGQTLIAYGYYSSTGTLTGLCADKMPAATWCGTLPTQIIPGLPGGYKTGGAAPSLWMPSGGGTTVCVCDDDGSQYVIKKYTTTDSDANKVDTSSITIDGAKEVSC